MIHALILDLTIKIIHKKKSKRNKYVYDSVSVLAPSTHTLVSKSTKLTNDDVKKPLGSKFELTDNVAYGSKSHHQQLRLPLPQTEITAADL